MLAKFYRFHVLNDTGQTQTTAGGAAYDIRLMPWKFASDVLSYGTVITDDLGDPASLADGAASEGDVQDNSSNLYLGAKGYFEVTTDNASSDGPMRLFMEESDANGSDWPSDQADFDVSLHCRQLCIIDFAAADTRGKNFEI